MFSGNNSLFLSSCKFLPDTTFTETRLATGLHPDPLLSFITPPDLLALFRGWDPGKGVGRDGVDGKGRIECDGEEGKGRVWVLRSVSRVHRHPRVV